MQIDILRSLVRIRFEGQLFLFFLILKILPTFRKNKLFILLKRFLNIRRILEKWKEMLLQTPSINCQVHGWVDNSYHYFMLIERLTRKA